MRLAVHRMAHQMQDAQQLGNSTVERLLKRRNAALNKKQMWGELFQKAYRLSQPNRNVFDLRPMGQNPSNYSVEGMDIAWYVFDLTLMQASDTWVNDSVNSLCPPNKNWLKFISGSDVPKEKTEEVNKKLQERTALFFKFLHASNFQMVVQECFWDVVVSTGFMTVNPGTKEKPFEFASNPPDAIYADEGPRGGFDAYYRDWSKMPIEHAQSLWPKIRIPTSVTEKNEADEQVLTLYEMIHFNYDNEKWDYRVIYPDAKEICFQRTDNTSAFIGWRTKKLSGETYGRGPAMDAAPAAGTINQALYDEIVSANFRALPMFMGFDDGVFNPHNFKMVPNTILPCAPTASGTWPLQPIPPAGDIQWSMLILDELRQQIHNIMYTNPLPPVDDPKATATEILARKQANTENRSAKDSRIQREFFEPLVDRLIDILRGFGLWDDILVDGKIIDIQFETPLVMSQGQKEVMELMEHVQLIQTMYGPEAASGFYNTEKLSPWMATKLNVNLELIKSEAELVKMMEQVQEQQQAMIEAQNNEQGSTGASAA